MHAMRGDDPSGHLGDTLGHFQAHGYARLGSVLNAETLASLRERVDDIMEGRVTYPGMFFQMDAPTGRYEDAPLGLGWQGPSLEYRKLEKLELDDRIRSHIRHPLFEQLARRWLRNPGPVLLYRAILFNKGPPGGSDIPWHQDAGKLWGLSRDPSLQIWTALDDAPKNGGCLEVVPGSHLWGLATPLGGVIPKDQVALRQAEDKALALPVKAGEGLLIHNLIWHRSGRGTPGDRRRALSFCYLDAETLCVRTRRAPRRFFTAFDSE
jgi:phytanoyl-CoA hydroxylase